ncbi:MULTISPECIES: DUF309 domain-containing protein [Salinibaculum]|uniref:DUF309 domain-containing protein n=1 Tax=Salinibaculum TaxID=2732368 RepID=UPI0030D600D0
MDAHLRAGIAVYNAGGYHAAHDAWEDHWLDLESGTDDERFLHGLIQFTAAVFHARNGNWSGATGLATSAREYLAGLDDDYRGVDVAAVRSYLGDLAADPECIERRPPLALAHEGDRLALTDLDFESTAVAADVLAEEHGYDEAVVADAVEYARADLDDGKTESPFVTFLFDFVRDPESRGIVAQRLAEHVERRRSREEDVEGLFD